VSEVSHGSIVASYICSFSSTSSMTAKLNKSLSSTVVGKNLFSNKKFVFLGMKSVP